MLTCSHSRLSEDLRTRGSAAPLCVSITDIFVNPPLDVHLNTTSRRAYSWQTVASTAQTCREGCPWGRPELLFLSWGGGMRGAHKMKRQRHFLFQKPVWCHAASAGALVSHIQPIQTELCCQRRQAVIQADGEDKISFHFIIPNIKKSLGGMAAGGGHGGENKPNQEGGISFHLLNMRIILELTLSFNQNSDEQPPSSELKTAHLNIYLLLRLQSRTDSRKITEIQH